VREKNRVRAVLRNHAVAVPKRPGLWTKKGAAWLASVRLPQGERLAVDLASEAIASANARLARVEAELAKYAAAHPGVALLMTIPGVGVRTAEAFVAYVDDPSRFARVRQWAATSAWCRRWTAPPAATAAGTSPARARARSASC
jgi:transposase